MLIVEDELAIAEPLQYALRAEGLVNEHCVLGRQVVPRVRAGGVALVVLDVGLPDGSGFDVCRELRTFSDVPVIFLTARADVVDRVLGLELGADDYMCKPFSPRELVARVRARLRRTHAAPPTPAPAPWTVRGELAIDLEGHRIRFREQILDLTRYEYTLLAALLARPGAILSRAQLMARGWDSDADSADRTVDTHIKTLRAKLRSAGADKELIRTHRGLGYALEP
ncbi:MAG: two-component system response regulator CreB [Myxococcales bacterium]|nr:two-component system response regulator CreB [Myxococcales bacterium]